MNPLKIGKHTIPHPIVQGGMGVGVSWDRLAGAVSKEEGLGVISSVGTGNYENGRYAEVDENGRPKQAENFYSKTALFKIFENARKTCGDAPLGCNVLYAMNEYGRVVRDSCEAGADIIITGAGLPTNMPEFTVDFPDVALVPIVSSAKALNILCKRWEKRYQKIPDAVIVEGPLSGGHQGFTYEQCFLPEHQLENIVPQIIEAAAKIGDIPVIAAGGIWDKTDIDRFLEMGAAGVQMATRFIGTHECDVGENFKKLMVDVKESDIGLIKSPVGYPARAINTNLMELLANKQAPEIRCISNCVFPCNRGEEARVVGYCIADRLSDACRDDMEQGLFFTGATGYRINEIISVKELMHKLIHGE